ncbi:hypothetical protein OOS50_002641 [Escherichia coli O157]|nr:hypothetical protein [Escherichia coli O157]
MSMFLKMMSGYDLPDENTAKPCTILPLTDKCKVDFSRDEYGAPIVTVAREDGTVESYHPEGNTYFTEDRRTVATFAYSEYVSPGRRAHIQDVMGSLNPSDVYSQFIHNNRITHFMCLLSAVPRGNKITRKCRLSIDDRILANSIDKLEDFVSAMGYCFIGYSTTNPMDADDVYVLEFAVRVM